MHDSGSEPRRLSSSLRSASSFRKKSFTDAEVKTLKLKLHSAIVGNYSNPRKFFNKYDQDKDGRLAHEELKKCIRLGMKVKPSDLSDESVKDFIKVVDVDADGLVSVDEICNFVGISVDDGSTLDSPRRSNSGRSSGYGRSGGVASGSEISDAHEGRGEKRGASSFVKSMTTAGGNIVHKIRRAFSTPHDRNASVKYTSLAKEESAKTVADAATTNGSRRKQVGGDNAKIKEDHTYAEPEVAEEEDRKLIFAIIIMLAVVLIAIVDSLTTHFGERFSIALADWTLEHAPGSFILFHLIIMALIILCLPYGPLSVLSGALFEAKYGTWGVVVAGFVLYCSTLTAEYICFVLGRHKFRDSVQRRINKTPELHFLRSLDRLIVEGEGMNMVMLLRLAPLPKGPANYFLGTTSVVLWDFFVGSTIVNLPLCYMDVCIGAGAKHVDRNSPGMVAGFVAIVLLFLGLVTFIGLRAKKKLEKFEEEDQRQRAAEKEAYESNLEAGKMPSTIKGITAIEVNEELSKSESAQGRSRPQRKMSAMSTALFEAQMKHEEAESHAN